MGAGLRRFVCLFYLICLFKNVFLRRSELVRKSPLTTTPTHNTDHDAAGRWLNKHDPSPLPRPDKKPRWRRFTTKEERQRRLMHRLLAPPPAQAEKTIPTRECERERIEQKIAEYNLRDEQRLTKRRREITERKRMKD
jgi:hypothetical protein